jgi:hypothetical protein
MSQGRDDQQKHRILFGGTVTHNEDKYSLERIRVKPDFEIYQQVIDSLKDITKNGKSVLNAQGNDILEEFFYEDVDPFVYIPLIPVQLNIVPENNDYVHLIYYNWSENTGRKNQFYIKGPVSSAMSVARENSNQTKSIMAAGPNVKPGLPLKNSNGYFFENTKGVFAEPKDYGIYSKGRSDIILKDNEVLLRSKKTPILKTNEYPVTNPKRSFLQLSNFDSRTVVGTQKTITQNLTVSEQIVKLVEYEIYLGLDTEGPFSGNINIYNLPGKSTNTLTDRFTQQTVIDDITFTYFSHSFNNIETLQEVSDIINKVISGLNDALINIDYLTPRETVNVTDIRFPFFFRPSLSLQKKSLIGSDLEKKNTNTLISLIAFPKSQKLTNPGSGLISSKNKYGLKKVSKKVKYTPNVIQNGDFGYSVIGSEKIFFISNNSNIPGLERIQLKNSDVYGIDEPTLSGNYYNSTNSMVRGESLKDLLALIVKFLLNHQHLYHRETPFELTRETSPISKTKLTSEWKLFDTKVLNQNIRIN